MTAAQVTTNPVVGSTQAGSHPQNPPVPDPSNASGSNESARIRDVVALPGEDSPDRIGFSALVLSLSGWLLLPILGGLARVLVGAFALSRSDHHGLAHNLPAWIGVVLGLVNLVAPIALMVLGVGSTVCFFSLCGGAW